jgi:hypothetical protein
MTVNKIILSDRRPITIDADQWSVIAAAVWHNGEREFQANTIRRILVRQHADGRRLVYGQQCTGAGGRLQLAHQLAGTINPAGGFLLSADADESETESETIHAIRRVGDIIADVELAERCIAELRFLPRSRHTL